MNKILIVINNLGVGGAERLVVDDIHEMVKRGMDVSLLTFKKEKINSLMSECLLSKDKIMLIDSRSIWDVYSLYKTYLYIKKMKPDMILSHLWFSNVRTLLICKILGIREIFIFEHNVYDLVKNKKMYFVDRLLQNIPKKIIAVSSAVKESLIQHGIKSDRIVVVHNGINLSLYKTEKNYEYREKLGIPQDVFVFTTIGRLIDQKGIDILIQAFSKGLPNAHLIIVGQGPQELVFKKKVEDLGISHIVHFLGIRKDIPDILACSDCFVLASRWEGLGIVVLEAMASKLPIIISDFKAGKDMIKSGISGLVVQRENHTDLFLAMQKMATDSVLRSYLSENAHIHVQQFSIQSHVNNIIIL